MNRRGGVEEHLGEIILVSVGFIIMIMVLGGFYVRSQKDESKVTCSANLIFSALTSKVPFAEQVPVQCRMKLTTINKAALDKELVRKEKEYKRMVDVGSPVRSKFLGPGGKEEWGLNSLVALEMAECWNKVLQGKLNVFKGGGAIAEESICIVCSQLVFEKDLPAYYPSYGESVENAQAKMILSLDDFLKNKAFGPESYYDFLARGQTAPPSGLASLYSPAIEYAVVYMEIKPSWAGWVRGKVEAVTSTTAGTLVLAGLTAASFLTPGGWIGLGFTTLRAGLVTTAVLNDAAVLANAIGTGAAAKAAKDATAAAKSGDTGKVLLLAPFNSVRAAPEKGGLGCGKVFA